MRTQKVASVRHGYEYSGGVKKKAADLLGMTFRSVRYWLRKLGMEAESEE